MNLVTILGGTGVFGGRIATDLSSVAGIEIRLVARDPRAGRAAAERIQADFRCADLRDAGALKRAIDGSTLVIHAAGPFQGHDYRVAQTCIDVGCHYMDLADARDFVSGFDALDAAARRRNVFITSGASSVPAVTSALINAARNDFDSIDTIQIALSPGNQNPRGASTIAAILSYLGRPIRIWQQGGWTTRPGWSDVQRLEFPPPVGRRRVHNCDVPDLELFPAHYAARTVRFHAGVELNVINYTLSILAALRRIVPAADLPRLAPLLLRGSQWLYPLGSGNGSLAVWIVGIDHNHQPIERRMAVVTRDDGPATPCAPATILTQTILARGAPAAGARPCVGLITLAELESHLQRFGVWIARGDERGWSADACNPV